MWQSHGSSEPHKLTCCSSASPPQKLINHHLAREGRPRIPHVEAWTLSPPQCHRIQAPHQGCSIITAGGSGMQERQSCCSSIPGVPTELIPALLLPSWGTGGTCCPPLKGMHPSPCNTRAQAGPKDLGGLSIGSASSGSCPEGPGFQ